MKKNDVLLVISVAIYSYLFYSQTPGVNFLLFTLALVAVMLIRNWTLILNRAWVACALGSILSGICVTIYGDLLPVFANVVSLSLAAGLTVERNSSLAFTLLYAAYSYASSVIYMAIDFMQRQQRQAEKTQTPYAKVLVTIIPIVITVIFFFLYREANPLFMDFTKNINFDFLTFGWFRFVLFGFILLYAFFYPRFIPYLLNKDKASSDNLRMENFPLKDDKSQFMGYSNEHLSGLMLFAMLNLLLLTVNALDVNYICFSSALPEGVTYSQFVHQGVEILIASIIFAVGIILFYFRGRLNFYTNNKSLKILAYLWVIQNAVLIGATIAKNNLYIGEYSLTYKRIGVYIYLTLCLIGLVTTFIKIVKAKSNWFLFRKNAWAFYGVLLVSCFINWDVLIARYNIYYSKQNLDKEYLLSLSDSVIPELLKLEEDPLIEGRLQSKVARFEEKYKAMQWQSWNYETQQINKSLKGN